MTRICAGVDAGSRAIKIVLLDMESSEVLAMDSTDQGVRQAELTCGLLDRMLAAQGMSQTDIVRTVATGYGRNRLDFADSAITEITCHARGVRHLIPTVRTIVEIGGQDSKIIRLDENGLMLDFAMNDRCAAGTGRFMELVATRLELELGQLGEWARRSTEPAVISSMCVVFAETEIIGLLASGTRPEDIIAGVQESVIARVCAMVGRSVAGPVAFTGGVARIDGMSGSLAKRLDQPVSVVANPQMTGALGAALLAIEQCAIPQGALGR